MKKIVIGIGIIIPTLMFAQIQIDHNEIPHTIGMYWAINDIDSTTVNVGSAGGPHTWDFSGLPIDTLLLDTGQIVDKVLVDSLFGDSFPEANFVAYQAFLDGGTFWERLLNDSLCRVGSLYYDLFGAGWEVCRIAPSLRMPLPISYGNQWASFFQINFTMMGEHLNLNGHLHYNVDAYGQVQLDWGTFNCLRVLVYDTILTGAGTGGPYYDTSATIEYEFWAENYGEIVKITSLDGETNPDFTTGRISFMTAFFQNKVEENSGLRVQNSELKVYPNPFCRNVNIRYSVPAEGKVSLRIYDVGGKLVRVLIDENKKAGNYNSMWDGMNEDGIRVNSGVYFYELSTPAGKMRQKLVMLK